MENEDQSEELFTLRDVEGNTQNEVVEELGSFYTKLRASHPSLRAISILGSSVKGYAKGQDEPSDTDVCLMFDGSEAGDDVVKALEDANSNIKEHNKEAKHPIEFHDFIDLSTLSEKSEAIEKSPQDHIAGLIYPSVGDVDSVDKAIEEVRMMVKSFNTPDKWAWKFANRIVDKESIALMLDRTTDVVPDAVKNPSLYNEHFYKLKDDRIDLYYKRILQLFCEGY